MCRLASEVHINSIFLHNFMKGVEREEEEEKFSDSSVEEAGSEEGDTQHLLMINCWLLCKS